MLIIISITVQSKISLFIKFICEDQLQLEFVTTIVEKYTTVYYLHWYKTGIELLIGNYFLDKIIVAFCHIQFQSIPSLMPFTLTDDPHFYGLKMSLSNIWMIGLFCSNNKMVIFFKREKKFMSQQTRT